MTEDDDKTRILRGRPADEAATRVLTGSRTPATEDDDDGDRTRVLTQVPGVVAKPAVVAAAGKAGESIVFQCPNGHRIVVGKQFAGRQGKCNKCGAAVRIPLASVGGGTSSSVPMIGPPPEDDEGEATDDASAGESAPSLSALAFGDLGAKPQASVDGLSAIGVGSASESKIHEEVPDWNFEAGSSPGDAAGSGWSGSSLPPSFDTEEGNPTSQLVARLWLEREHGGVVELHLDGGAVLLPEWYESKWSKGTHGLFASQAADGSVTLTAVAWESVQKVVVRQLGAVPDDMFT